MDHKRNFSREKIQKTNYIKDLLINQTIQMKTITKLSKQI